MPVREAFLAFVDTETGGTTPGKDPVIEVATILTDLKRREIARFESKIQLRAGDVVSAEAAAINGYTAEVWAREARPFSTYINFLKAHVPYGTVAIPVGHNVGFDRDMIDLGYYKPMRAFCPLSYRKADTLSLAMALRCAGVIECEDLKLVTVAKAMGIETPAAHRAMADCETAKTIFERAIDMFAESAARRATAAKSA
jgi:DNA polymerase III alpha subunit (gram-positive type)